MRQIIVYGGILALLPCLRLLGVLSWPWWLMMLPVVLLFATPVVLVIAVCWNFGGLVEDEWER